MLEVFTVGGGEYLVNTFNAVAAWSGGGGYRSLLRVVMVMGLIYSLCVVAFTLNFRAWMNWFIQATAIYLCLMVPTVDVRVTDRINPGLAPATIDNVPLGLGVLASFTTQIGDWLTRTAETVFVMSGELNYSTNGMIYGARLFDATRNFIIRDAEFTTNLEEHFKKCVFGDVMLYRKSLTDLAQSKDLWADLGPGSEARAQQWLERQGDGTVSSFIVTCRQAYAQLDAQWIPMIDANAPLWGKELYPRLSNALAADKLRHDVPIVNAAFTGSGNGFTEAMRQNTAINAFMQARNSMAGGSGDASIDTFAQTRADIQARNTYNSIAQQAMAWVPILNIVLTVVFFAMFPVIFPLFLMPQTGVGTLKGYAMGFFYLAAWGPLYVILHMICMTRAESAASGVAGGGVSLGSYAGIGAVNGETATIAGFMLMSIPFLAAGLARGAMSIAGQATSMLAPAQNAAEAAAMEQTTGNYSYGNVSWANQTSNMRQSDQWTTAPAYMGGAASFGWRHDNGAISSQFGDGHYVTDMTGALDRLDYTATGNRGSVNDMKTMFSAAERALEAVENSANQSLSSTHTNRSGFGTSSERSKGFESGSGHSNNTSVEEFDRRTGSTSQSLEERSSTGQSQRVSDGHDRTAGILDQVNGSLGVNGGAGIGRGSSGVAPGQGRRTPSISGGIGISKIGSQNDSLRHATEETRSTDSSSGASNGSRDEHSNGSSASASAGTYERGGVFARSSSTASSSQTTEDALARTKTVSESKRKLQEIMESLSREIGYSENHGHQLSQNYNHEFAEWYRNEQGRHPNMDVPELWATDLTAHQRQVKEEMVQQWWTEKRDSIWNEINEALRQVDLVEVDQPDFGTAAEVRASYQPHGVARISSGASGGNPAAASKIISEGRQGLEADQAVVSAGRAVRLHGSVDVQEEVNHDLGKGFFTDPDLRR